MKAIIRPATAADFERMACGPLPHRVRAFAVENGGELLGIGGLAYLPDGAIGAFVHQVPGAGKQYPVTLHKAGLMAMSEAKRLGFCRVVAMADGEIDGADRWLERLGFEREIVEGQTVYVWNKKDG